MRWSRAARWTTWSSCSGARHTLDEGLECAAQPVPVNALVKGRPLDNMEFMQWFKAYADARGGCQPGYDGPGRRAHAKTGDMRGTAGAPRHAMGGGAGANAAHRRGSAVSAAAAARDNGACLHRGDWAAGKYAESSFKR